MSDETLDIEAIQARADAATPGPWSAADEHGLLVSESDQAWCISRMGDETPNGPDERQWLYDVAEIAYNEPRPGGQSQADAEFIAAARTDVPALVAAVRSLRTQRDEATAETERQRDSPHCCPPCSVHPDPEPREIERIAASIDMGQIVAQGGVDTGWLVAHVLRESGIGAREAALAAQLDAVRELRARSNWAGARIPVEYLDAALAAAVPVQPAEESCAKCNGMGRVQEFKSGGEGEGRWAGAFSSPCPSCSPAVHPVTDETDKQR